MTVDRPREQHHELQADQEVVDEVAAQLRHWAGEHADASAEHLEMAAGVASVLNELSRRLGNLDDESRKRIVETCSEMTNRTGRRAV